MNKPIITVSDSGAQIMFLRQFPRRLIGRLSSPYLNEAIWVLIGQVGVTLGTIVNLKVLTTLLPSLIYGQLNLLTVAIVLPAWLLLAPISQATIRKYATYRDKGEQGVLLWTAFTTHSGLIVTIGGIGIFIASWGFFDRFGLPRIVPILTCLLFMVEGWISFGLGVYGAARKQNQVALVSIGSVWLRTAFAALSVWFYGPYLSSVIFGLLLGALAMVGPANKLLFNELWSLPNKVFSTQLLRSVVAYGFPFGVWSIFAWLQNYADRYVVEISLGSAVLGSYVAAVQVAAFPFNFTGNLLSQFMGPIIFEKAGTGSEKLQLSTARRFLLRFSLWFFTLGFVFVALYAIVGPWLMKLLTHSDYVVPATVLTTLAVGALLTTTAQQLTLLILAHNKSKILIFCKVLPGVLGIPLVWVFAKTYGLFGAALGYAAVGSIFFAIVLGTTIWIQKSIFTFQETTDRIK